MTKRPRTGALADRAATLSPLNGEYQMARGAGCLATGDADRALADLNRAIELNSMHVYYSIRATIHQARGDLESAIADLSRAIDGDPENAGYHAQRAQSFNAAGKFDKASAVLPIYNSPLPYPMVLNAVQSPAFAPFRRMGQRVLYHWYHLRDEML